MRAPEIRGSLKGRNRVLFYAQLRRNVQRLLRDLGLLELRQRGGVLAVLSPAPVDELLDARDVLGVNLFTRRSCSTRRRRRHARLPSTCCVTGRPARSPSARAAATRAGASRRTSSPSSSARRCRTSSGSASISRAPTRGAPRGRQAELFAFSERIPGRGGLPVGVSGRAVCLLSGGIDSPVAAYRAMKRGLRCEFVHFSGGRSPAPSRSTRRTRRRRSSTASRAARVFTSCRSGTSSASWRLPALRACR